MSKGLPKKFKGRADKTLKRGRKEQRKFKIDHSKMNAGGFYEGMPGVTTDTHGNRKMIGFFVEKTGFGNAYIHAAPRMAKVCIEDVCRHNPMIKGIVRAAALDDLLSNKNPFNWPFILRYRLLLWWEEKKYNYKLKKRLKEDEKRMGGNIKDGSAQAEGTEQSKDESQPEGAEHSKE